MRKIMCLSFIILSLLFLYDVKDVYAAADPTIMSRVIKKFYDATSQFEKVFLQHAKNIFYWCAVLEIAFLGVKATLGVSEIKDTIKNFCIALLAAGFFLAVINNYHEWTWNIINGLKKIGGEATTLNEAADEPFTIGFDLAKTIFERCSGWKPIDSLVYIIAGVSLMLCFALTTLQIILIKCECMVGICAAALLVGLGATSFMRDYAINVIKYIVSVAFKLMVIYLLLGVGMSFFRELNLGNADWAEMGVAICFCIVFYSLVKTLPEIVAGIISGSHAGGGNTAAAMSTVALGSGAIGAAYAGARNVGLAYQGAKADGKTGLSAVTGTVSNLWNGAKQSRMEKEDRSNTLGAMLRQNLEKRG